MKRLILLMAVIALVTSCPTWAQITATVRPGYTFAPNERLTLDKLNLLGQPVIEVSGTLGGTNVGLAANTVSGTMLMDSVVGNATLQWLSTTPRGLAVNLIGHSNVSGGSLLGTNIAGGTITSSNLAGGTIVSTNIAGGTIVSTNIAGGGIEYSNMSAAAVAAIRGTGAVVGTTNNTFASYLSIVSDIAFDDTIPQITEGTEVVSVTYTPHAAANVLFVRTVVPVGSINTDIVGALFRNGTANALCSTYLTGVYAPLVFETIVTAGTTSAVTFSVRVGRGTPGGNVELNGWGGVRRLGGTMKALITVTEISQ
jgi:hypothetical protein